MPDWNTRLAVSYQQGTSTVHITPIDSFTPTFTLNVEALHSLEATHIGVIHSPQQMTFTLTVKAIGDVAAQLTGLALNGTQFDLLLQEQDGGHDWSFKSVVMSRCLITSAVPSAATIAGAPAATFSGFSLGASSEPKTGDKAEIPAKAVQL
jgi:hypothetical protein